MPRSRRAKWWRLGSIQGNVEATERIEIKKDAKLIGDIRTARIVIEDGAYFKGSIDIVKPEPAKVSMPRPQQSGSAAGAVARSGSGQCSGRQALAPDVNDATSRTAEESVPGESWTGRPERSRRPRLLRAHGLPRAAAKDIVSTRPSRGLEEFFSYIRDQSGLTILDLGGATQQNVSFITNLGHRLYSEDFLQILQETFGEEGRPTNPITGRIDYFLRQALDYPEGALRRRADLGRAGVSGAGAADGGDRAAAHDRAAEELHAGVLPFRRQAGRGAVLHVPHPGRQHACRWRSTGRGVRRSCSTIAAWRSCSGATSR